MIKEARRAGGFPGISRCWAVFHLAILAVAVSGCAGLLRTDPGDWRAAAKDDGAVSVMSFNLLVGGQPAEAAMETIAAASPDLLCLQEVTTDFAQAFAGKFSERYPHLLFAPHPTVQGIGMASRYPLSDGNLLPLGLPYMPALAATVQLEAQPVRIACAHFVPHLARFQPTGGIRAQYYINREIRTDQARRLLDHLDRSGLPTIVLGDLNEWPGQSALSIFAEAGFANACDAPGSRCGPTWPGQALSGPALVRIDHILGREIEFRQTAVLEAGGSDHYPVAAFFRPAIE